ncbi:MAG: hypothetical protein JWP02_54, partial [Acidimicrobiales bacterium]|nr:hypothetical protein [Acidimicrobiales bacterium]
MQKMDLVLSVREASSDELLVNVRRLAGTSDRPVDHPSV